MICLERASHQKRLGIYLDEKLSFKIHIETALCKVNKGVSIIKMLRHTLPRKSSLTIYQVFLRPHIGYDNIIYDQPSNESFCKKLESVQYKAAPAITGSIQGTSRQKSRRCFRSVCCMFKK